MSDKQKKIIVAIDGYSSCGKSTIAKQLARAVGYTYVDTGAMYRAVALFLSRKAQEAGKAELLNDTEWVERQLPAISIRFVRVGDGQHVTLNGEDVEAQIRTLEIGNRASQVSTIGAVRRFLVAQQQAMGNDKGIVMDGRDIGTVVFPDAELKLFLTASPEVRAQRRFLELQEKGEQPVFEEVLRDLGERDYRDTHRQESPLRKADDAIEVDNSNLTREQQTQHILDLFNKCIAQQ